MSVGRTEDRWDMEAGRVAWDRAADIAAAGRVAAAAAACRAAWAERGSCRGMGWAMGPPRHPRSVLDRQQDVQANALCRADSCRWAGPGRLPLYTPDGFAHPHQYWSVHRPILSECSLEDNQRAGPLLRPRYDAPAHSKGYSDQDAIPIDQQGVGKCFLG